MTISSSAHHSFDITLAAEYGIEEAIIIHHFQHWIGVNARLDRNFYEGRYWTYQTLKEIAAHFPYLNERKVKYAVQCLVEKKVLKTGNFNKKGFDKTVWYSFENQEMFMKDKIVHAKDKIVHPSDKIVKPIPNTKPYSKPKETTTEEPQASCCSSLKKEIIEALPISQGDKAYIEAKYSSLDDETFKSAIQAYKQYAEKTALDSHYRTILKALGEKWTVNAETEKDKEAKARTEEETRFERELSVKYLKDYLYSWKISDIRINQTHPTFFEYQVQGRAITRQLYLSDDFDKVVSELQMRAQDEKRKIDERKGL